MPSDGRTDYQHGKAYGRHVVLETIRHKAEVPHWVDAIIVRIIGLVHCVLFVGGLAVCGLGIVLSAGMAPSWTAASVSGMGGLVMLSTGTAIYALGVRPSLDQRIEEHCDKIRGHDFWPISITNLNIC